MVDTLVRVRQPESGTTETPEKPLSIEDALRSIPGSLLPAQIEESVPELTGSIEFHDVAERATPDHMEIGTLPNDLFRLKRPINVKIELEDSEYIAACDFVDEFGFGSSPMQAVDDLRSSIVELYLELKEKRDELGAGLLETLSHLGELIEEV